MKPVGVSDHAVLRYLERVGGFEIEKLRSEIAEAITAEYENGMTYVSVGGAHFVVRQDHTSALPVVTTVLIPKARKRLKPRREFDDEI